MGEKCVCAHQLSIGHMPYDMRTVKSVVRIYYSSLGLEFAATGYSRSTHHHFTRRTSVTCISYAGSANTPFQLSRRALPEWTD
jgi:hypothetical protein